jgi:hypothetical protein
MLHGRADLLDRRAFELSGWRRWVKSFEQYSGRDGVDISPGRRSRSGVTDAPLASLGDVAPNSVD